MAEQTYKIEISSDPANLITIEEFINYIAVETNLPEARLPGILLAVTEATTNAIIHANKKDVNKKVVIEVVDNQSEVMIMVTDEGSGFDPDKIPDPTQPENLLKDSGRGLYLMRVYADELKYEISPAGTKTILVIKH